MTRRAQDYAPPSEPPPGWTAGDRDDVVGGQSRSGDYTPFYAPPPGPPPRRQDYNLNTSAGNSAYVHQNQHDQYQAPPGPPPSWTASTPQYQPEHPAPEYNPHDWQSFVPDTSTYPPPPSLGNDYSTGANATKEESEQGMMWCNANPLWPAQHVSPEIVQQVRDRKVEIIQPQYAQGSPFRGTIEPSRSGDSSTWRITSTKECKDSTIMPVLPSYLAIYDSPLVTSKAKTIYFEVKILSLGSSRSGVESGVAIGFTSPPYPPFRLPGWHRGSLGVHSDDGRRYVNDTDGGIDFVRAFRVGETVGVGIRFKVPSSFNGLSSSSKSIKEGQPQLQVQPFFTRNGHEEGSWDLFEERDALAQKEGVDGLDGRRDLFLSVGVFGSCSIELVGRKAGWMFHGI